MTKEAKIEKPETQIKKEETKPAQQIKKEVKDKKFVEKVKTLPNINDFFDKNKIKILNIIDKKKKSSSEYIVRLPTPVGYVKFYCAVLIKSRISDADMSKVIVKSQMRKLPGLLIYSGQLTLKAQELSKSISDIIMKRFEDGC